MKSFTYTLGRASIAAARPLCLFAANNYLVARSAQDLAVAFLAVALALLGVTANPDRRFYSRYFDTSVKVNGLTFYLYGASVGLLAVIGSFAAFGISVWFSGSLWLGAAVVAYFLSEKLVDEVNRLHLFEREFERWGRGNTQRTALQLAGTAALLLLGQNLPAAAIVLVLAAANFSVYVARLPPGLVRNIVRHGFRTACWLVRRATILVVRSWMLWAIALTSAAVGYLDRLVTLTLDKATLPLFMLVVMCFSVVQMAVDFYYVSRHRRDFLEQRISLRQALTSRVFLTSLTVGLTVSIVATVIVLLLSKNGSQFPVGYVAIIAILQVCLSVTGVPREIVYWSRHLPRILGIELRAWGLFAFAALLWRMGNLSIMVLFGAVAACALVRLLLYSSAAHAASAAGQSGDLPLQDRPAAAAARTTPEGTVSEDH
jgi:hypothetical protein